MLELPESSVISDQLNATILGKVIKHVEVLKSPHKFAWFYGDPAAYPEKLIGKTFGHAKNLAGLIEIEVGDMRLVFGDGVNLRFFETGSVEKNSDKHQLGIEFEDGSALNASVQMYGGLWCFEAGTFENPYYLIAQSKPSPLTEAFDKAYYMQLIEDPKHQKLTMKALLATEQRIPGLGNGVLQDILYNAGLHPKRKLNTLIEQEKESLFDSIKNTLADMKSSGGRDTEKDLFGRVGGYQTRMSKLSAGRICHKCQGIIHKENYMGGSIYYCDGCQKLS